MFKGLVQIGRLKLFLYFLLMQRISVLFALEKKVLDSRVQNSIASYPDLCVKGETLPEEMVPVESLYMVTSLKMRILL